MTSPRRRRWIVPRRVGLADRRVLSAPVPGPAGGGSVGTLAWRAWLSAILPVTAGARSVQPAVDLISCRVGSMGSAIGSFGAGIGVSFMEAQTLVDGTATAQAREFSVPAGQYPWQNATGWT